MIKAGQDPAMHWELSYRADPRARPLADRHYNRRKIGSPQFVPPGRCLVLLTKPADCLWVTSWPFAEYTKHRWPGAWVNSLFRREGGPPASQLIREAIAATVWRWPSIPPLGMVTFIDRKCVKGTKVRGEIKYGMSYLKAGFIADGETKGGLLAFRLPPENMPPGIAPYHTSTHLLGFA